MSNSSRAIHPIFSGIELGIGTWAWGDRLFWGFKNGYDENDIEEAFDTSIEMGISFFDTAEIYGQGKSESYLGRFIHKLDKPVLIATKFFPLPWRLTPNSLIKALKNSLKRLDVETVDLYQIHQPYSAAKVETWMDGLAMAVEAGLTRAVGVSNYNLNLTNRAFQRLKSHGVQLASNQVEFSLLDRRPEKTGLLSFCEQNGIKLIAYSPLGMGMLTGKYTPDNPPKGYRSNRYSRQYLTKIQPLIKMIKQIGAEHGGKTAAEVAINWTICKGTLPIPGIKTANQALTNAGAVGWRLTDTEIAQLDEQSDIVTGYT